MKTRKTELIKNAINQMVIITDINDKKYTGWLVVSIEQPKRYELLNTPVCAYVFAVSHIKHIEFASNRKRLW